MSNPSQIDVKNILLGAMDAPDFARFSPHLEKMRMRHGEVVARADKPMSHIHFPESALGSIVSVTTDGHRVEAGIFGKEGMSGLPVFLNAEQSPNEYLMQVEGESYRLPSPVFRKLAEESDGFRDLMLRYAHCSNVQAQATAVSNAVHRIDQRLARWLLMSRDRLGSDTLHLTHEFLSVMLGVRRPGVTTALHVLEGHLLIRGERGRITIRDRKGLEEFAGDAYGVPEAEYRRLIAVVD